MESPLSFIKVKGFKSITFSNPKARDAHVPWNFSVQCNEVLDM